MPSAVRVKICGVTKPEYALAAADAGADYIGLMFAESPRKISAGQAREIVLALKHAEGDRPKTVGVFVNRPPAEISAMAKEVGFDMAQLSGDEPEGELDSYTVPLIKVVHVDTSAPESIALLTLRRKLAFLTERAILPMLDAKVKGKYGGTGQTFDHSLAKSLAQEFDFLLAGGLSPDSIADVIAQVHPWGVDVSSGVETNGVKDVAKIRDFLRKAKT
ncbi:MAG: phosphoribosylanthranilate isomerase [Chloroflexi bacterium]|nr:phosphoribosylanthranilate isomerase [Chloroflexota bacterium]